MHDRMAKVPIRGNSLPQTVVTPLDRRSEAFLVEQDTKWIYKDNRTAEELADALSDCMKAAGVVPSIRNLTNVLTAQATRLPRWLPSVARHSLLVDTVKDMFHDLGDWTLRVSEDGHLGLTWMDTNTVLVFKNGTNRIEGSRWDRVVDKDEAAKEALAELQGEWVLVSGSLGGPPATPVRQIYNGTEVTTMSTGRPDLIEQIAVDPTKPAKAIDFEMTDGSGAIRKRLGIYSLGNDKLILEVADPGGERPRHFFSGGHMSQWRREGTTEPKP
jgi:uncharacterized protein (TIGR03067 family)